MVKQLICTMALLSGNYLAAMEQAKAFSLKKESSQNKALVKILVTDSQNGAYQHELLVPIHLAKLIGTISGLLDNSALTSTVFPFDKVTLVSWGLIESQLERVYGMLHGDRNADHVRKEILAEYAELHAEVLMKVVHALDYMDIPFLLEIACDVVIKSDLAKFTYEQLSSLPGALANSYIVHKVFSLCGPMITKERLQFKAHEKYINSVCLTRNGKIVTGSWDNTVRVWDRQGKQLAVCEGHDAYVRVVVVSDDDRIVSCSDDATLRIWDMEGNQQAVCSGHEKEIRSFCLTNDGKIVSDSADRTARVWDMKGNELAVYRGHREPITSLCVTNDGMVVSGSWDTTVQIWDMRGNTRAICKGTNSSVSSVCVTKDGTQIISAHRDETLRVWDMDGNQVAVCRGHTGEVLSVALTRDNKIISGSSDKTVRIWDLQGTECAVIKGTAAGGVWSVCVMSGGKIVLRSYHGSFYVWDVDGNQLAECPVSIRSLGVSDDGTIVSGDAVGIVRVWDCSLADVLIGMDESKAQALLKMIREYSHQGAIDKQQLWRDIEKLVTEEDRIAPANVRNNGTSCSLL